MILLIISLHNLVAQIIRASKLAAQCIASKLASNGCIMRCYVQAYIGLRVTKTPAQASNSTCEMGRR
eukprot:COSAG01_NODE_3763_length_5720_cov_3.247109_4_plen_67_part_00